MIKMTIQDAEETAEFKVLEKPIIQKPLIAESDVVTIDNNLSTYVTGTQKRELTVGLGYLDSVGYETLRRIRDRQYAVLKYPTVTITADEPVEMGYGEDVPDYRQRLVQLKGKNLFNKDSAPQEHFYINGNTLSDYNGDLKVSTYIPIAANTTYTITKPILSNNRFAVGTCSAVPAIGVSLTNSLQNNNVSSITITSGSTDKYLVVYFKQGSDTTPNSTIFAQIQIELGSTATTYESYINIELCKIGDYQDYVYPSGGKWYLHKTIDSIKLVGSQNWEKSSTMTSVSRFFVRQIFPSGYLKNDNHKLAIIMSNYFMAISQNSSDQANLGISQLNDRGIMINVQNGVFADATAFNAWLTAHDVDAYYILATPTDIEITNETLIAQLDALQNSAFNRWTQIETSVQELSLQPYLTVTQGEITGSGKEVMLEGTTEDLLDFVILGDTVQDGTPTPDSPVPIQTVNGDITFDFSGPSGVKRYTMVGKMTLADQRIIDNCGTNEQVQVSFRESKQI